MQTSGRSDCRGESIEEHPKEVDDRKTSGHWDMDTVVNKKGGSLARVLSITDRMTRWQINVKIKTGETKSVIEILDKLEKKRLTVYHCHPYCSSKCDSNEKERHDAPPPEMDELWESIQKG